jgi:hypothetical protein
LFDFEKFFNYNKTKSEVADHLFFGHIITTSSA